MDLTHQKQTKIRNAEYYDMIEIFDKLYKDSQDNIEFTKLMKIISSENNILLAYRNIKKNSGSMTAGTDKRTIKDLEKLSTNELIQMVQKSFKHYIPKSVIEFIDNRISLYCAQHGKCAITGEFLEIDDIHCHHKIAKKDGGTDSYSNLIIIHKNIHILLHATKDETIKKYIEIINPTPIMLKKINELREKLMLNKIIESLKYTKTKVINLLMVRCVR